MSFDGLRQAMLTLLLALVCTQTALAEAPPASRQEVRQAVEQLRADPLLGHMETTKRLHFKKSEREHEPKVSEQPNSHPARDWLVSFLKWLSTSARVLMWVLGAFLAVFVLVGLWRWLGVRSPAIRLTPETPPSHVQNLDIRPQSLPEEIGAAAAALWQRGEQRAALSLLYRGALSRLAHGHALPIRAASTEGDCVKLANRRLDTPRARFFARLVGVWQQAVYGGRMPENEQALALCREFDGQLAAAAPEAAR
ncbi:MAG: DUF4129 domain-containing protein [Azonexus sp.]|jgi:hypothetical protein|nr:DUF4129 domain-containing protein [Azonexus sp.]